MQRLKTRPQFQAVLGAGLVAKTSHFAMHRLELGATASTPPPVIFSSLFPVKASWLGAMAPKRWAKRAATRNAIKRQIYTVSASLRSSIPQAAFLIRLRREFSRMEYASASSEALKQAIRAELLVLMQSGWPPTLPLSHPRSELA
jgi:ribonuclease P protein component